MPPPPLGPNLFIFMHFLEKNGQIVGWLGVGTPPWEMIDPQMKLIYSQEVVPL